MYLMGTEDMDWLWFSLLAMGLWGLWGFLSQVATLKLSLGTIYLFSLVGHVAVIGYLVATGGVVFTWYPGSMAAALGAGICMAFGLLSFFKALAGGPPICLVVPLTALYPMVTVILSWTLLREGFTLRQLAGLVLALPAVWLLASAE